MSVIHVFNMNYIVEVLKLFLKLMTDLSYQYTYYIELLYYISGNFTIP